MGMRIDPMPKPTEDVSQGKENLDRYGITIHDNFLSAEQVAALRDRLDEQAELERERGVATFADGVGIDSAGNVAGDRDHLVTGRPIGIPAFQSVALLVNKGRVFIDLAKHPIAQAYAGHGFRGVPFKVGTQLGFIVRQGASAQGLHIDQRAIPFATPIPMLIGVTVALSDYAEPMGATRMMPGSHRWEGYDPQHPAAAPVETVPVILQPGSAAIWESRVWHGQGASVSAATRYSVITLYAVHFLSAFDCYPAAMHDDVYAQLSDEERALYGFAQVGSGGRIGPRTADDVRQNVGRKIPYVPELHRSDANKIDR